MKTKQSFMSRKFYSILLGGTLTSVMVSVLLLSDTVIAGTVLGENAVVGISLVTPMYSLSAFFGYLFSLGLPILYSNAMGRFDKKSADRYFGFGLTVSVSIGVIMFVSLLFLGDRYLQSYQPSAAVFEQAKAYFFWYKLTILVMPLSDLMIEMLLADGDEKTCTVASLVRIVSNLLLSILLCRHLGIAGIGMGTFCGTILSLAICFSHFLQPGNSLVPNVFFSWSIIPEVVRYSTIDAGTYLFLAAFTAMMNRFVVSEFGSDHLILVSIILILKEGQLVFDGIGEAITPIMSIYLGEGLYDGVRRCWRLAEVTAVLEGLVMTLLVMISSFFLPQMLGIQDPALADCAIRGIRLMSLSLPFVSLLYLVTSYDLVIDRIWLGFFICAMRDLLQAMPLAMMLGRLFDENGMFTGVMLAPIFSYVVGMLFVRLRYGKENYPLMLADREKSVRAWLYDVKVEPEAIIDVQGRIARNLVENGVDDQTVGMVKLLVEELFVLVYEKNNGDPGVKGECGVIIEEDGVRLIMKDDGVLFDLSDENAEVVSFAVFAVSSYMTSMGKNKQNLTTMSFNRNTFLIRRAEMV